MRQVRVLPQRHSAFCETQVLGPVIPARLDTPNPGVLWNQQTLCTLPTICKSIEYCQVPVSLPAKLGSPTVRKHRQRSEKEAGPRRVTRTFMTPYDRSPHVFPTINPIFFSYIIGPSSFCVCSCAINFN